MWFPRWPRGVDARAPGVRALDVRQGPQAVADERRRAGQVLAVLADNTAASDARMYWENRNLNLISAAAQKTDEIWVPVAITVFPDEIYRPPATWAGRAFRNLIDYHEADRGGHFAGAALVLP